MTITLENVEPIVVLDVVLLAGGSSGAPVDGLGSRIVGTDLRDVRALAFRVPRVGSFGVQIRALDVRGCRGSSAGQVRNVVVR